MSADLAALKREARRKGTPPERLLELANMEPAVARAIVTSRHVPPEILSQLAQSDDWITRARVAKHKKTSLADLVSLSNDRKEAVVENIILNKNVPEKILRQLLSHNDSTIRRMSLHRLFFRGLLSHEEILENVDSEDGSTRWIIAVFWKKIPESLAMRYLNDPEKSVRLAILKRQLDTRPIYKRRRGRPYRLIKLLPVEVIKPLLNDEDEQVRNLAAQIVNRMNELQGETP